MHLNDGLGGDDEGERQVERVSWYPRDNLCCMDGGGNWKGGLSEFSEDAVFQVAVPFPLAASMALTVTATDPVTMASNLGSSSSQICSPQCDSFERLAASLILS